MRIAVVGAGLSGLGAARRLAQSGCEVVVVEKGRGLGGRVASRRAGGAVLDHGTPVLTAPAGSALAALVEELLPGAHVSVPWPPAGPGQAPAGTALAWPGGATLLAKAAAEGLEVVRELRVEALRQTRRGLELGDGRGNPHGVFDAVVVTAPAPQAAAILARSPEDGGRADVLRSLPYAPAVMVLVGARLADPPPFVAAHPPRGPLALVVSEAAKGRAAAAGVWPLVARLAPDASAALVDAADEDVLAQALPALAEAVGPAAGAPAWSQVKRWRLAVPLGRLAPDAVNPPGCRILVAGDALAGARLDGASHAGVYDSGVRAAERLLHEMAPVG